MTSQIQLLVNTTITRATSQGCSTATHNVVVEFINREAAEEAIAQIEAYNRNRVDHLHYELPVTTAIRLYS